MNWRIITLSAVDCVVPLNNYSAQKLNGVLFYPKVQVEITTTHPSNSYPVSVQYMFSFFFVFVLVFFFHAQSSRRLLSRPSFTLHAVRGAGTWALDHHQLPQDRAKS